MSDKELVDRLREDRSVKTDRLEAADYIEHCHASHDAMAAEIEVLRRERDEAFQFRDNAWALYKSSEEMLTHIVEQRDTAERKVEKLREALCFVGNIAHAEGDTAGICDIVRAALAETEKADD